MSSIAPVIKLSIVIPAYNEGATIVKILEQIEAVELLSNLAKEVIVVDDCSEDNTAHAVQQYQANHPNLSLQYHKHAVN